MRSSGRLDTESDDTVVVDTAEDTGEHTPVLQNAPPGAFGYLFDRAYGVLPYSPIFLLALVTCAFFTSLSCEYCRCPIQPCPER